MPNSSHKYMVNAMNYAATKGLHKVTLKGKGWNSNGYTSKARQKTRSMYAEMFSQPEEIKRPKSIKTQLHCLD